MAPKTAQKAGSRILRRPLIVKPPTQRRRSGEVVPEYDSPRRLTVAALPPADERAARISLPAPVTVELEGLYGRSFVRENVVPASNMTLDRMIRAGSFVEPSVYIGRKPFWTGRALHDWLKELVAAASQKRVHLATRPGGERPDAQDPRFVNGDGFPHAASRYKAGSAPSARARIRTKEAGPHLPGKAEASE
jgi:hypothetical protein